MNTHKTAFKYLNNPLLHLLRLYDTISFIFHDKKIRWGNTTLTKTCTDLTFPPFQNTLCCLLFLWDIFSTPLSFPVLNAAPSSQREK